MTIENCVYKKDNYNYNYFLTYSGLTKTNPTCNSLSISNSGLSNAFSRKVARWKGTRERPIVMRTLFKTNDVVGDRRYCRMMACTEGGIRDFFSFVDGCSVDTSPNLTKNPVKIEDTSEESELESESRRYSDAKVNKESVINSAPIAQDVYVLTSTPLM